MRVHQATSSASIAREKWTRPRVVGPSPVMTPSRTTASARAAVSADEIWEGSRAAWGLARSAERADMEALFQFLVLIRSASYPGQHSRAAVNEWLMIRNRTS